MSSISSGRSSVRGGVFEDSSSSLFQENKLDYDCSSDYHQHSVGFIKFPHMNTIPLRLSTFSGADVNPKFQTVNIYQLAKAGFFYARKHDDSVTCYACGVVLNNWEWSDIPEAEHLRWSPSCRVVKGNQYNKQINDIIQRLLKLKLA